MVSTQCHIMHTALGHHMQQRGTIVVARAHYSIGSTPPIVVYAAPLYSTAHRSIVAHGAPLYTALTRRILPRATTSNAPRITYSMRTRLLLYTRITPRATTVVAALLLQCALLKLRATARRTILLRM